MKRELLLPLRSATAINIALVEKKQVVMMRKEKWEAVKEEERGEDA